MKISFNDIQKAISEFNVPYNLHKACPKTDKLLERLNEEDIHPYELVHYLYRHWGPDKLLKDVLCSEALWTDFINYRRIRIGETSIRADLEKHRLNYLLHKGCEVRDIVTSEVETFFVLLKYILARIGDLEDLVDLYEEGARYELRTKPELRKYLKEFGDRYFPKI